MRWRRPTFVAILATGACTTSYRSADDPDAGADADADADAAVSDGRQDAGDPANLVQNGDFEARGAGCGPFWRGIGNTILTRDALAHSGSSSCRVCDDGTPASPSGAHLLQNLDAGAGSYVVEAFVRAPVDASPPPSVLLGLTYALADGGLERPQKRLEPLPSDWQIVQVIANVPAGTPAPISVVVVAPLSPGACFLVDDVRVERQ